MEIRVSETEKVGTIQTAAACAGGWTAVHPRTGYFQEHADGDVFLKRQSQTCV